MTELVDLRKTKTYGPYEFKLGDELRGERATLGRSLLDIQRDLRIKAAYIAAIENCDPSVFPNPSFIAGYVRSYARYLNLDPEEIYWRFCQESGFSGPARAGAAPPTLAERFARKKSADGVRPAAGEFYPVFPLAERAPRVMPDVPLAAIGSFVVLVALVAGLGYGGWAILQNIQRVEFAPVDEVPVALADLPRFEAPEAGATDPILPELATPVAATALVDLYRRQELEVPILVPRDGPIAAIDPDAIGLLAPARAEPPAATPALGDLSQPVSVETAAAALAAPEAAAEAVPLGEDGRPRLTIIAERPAWVRVYFAGGQVLFEQILESGEMYELPPTAEIPLIWAGNSGSVYVRIGDTIHGPLGDGTRAVRDLSLDPEVLGARYEPVGELPSVIFEAISSLAQNAAVLRQ